MGQHMENLEKIKNENIRVIKEILRRDVPKAYSLPSFSSAGWNASISCAPREGQYPEFTVALYEVDRASTDVTIDIFKKDMGYGFYARVLDDIESQLPKE